MLALAILLGISLTLSALAFASLYYVYKLYADTKAHVDRLQATHLETEKELLKQTNAAITDLTNRLTPVESIVSSAGFSLAFNKGR